MRNTLINLMHENNRHKRTIAVWEYLEILSASIECLDLEQEHHDSLINTLKSTIEVVESSSFTKGKMLAEKECNSDIRALIQRLDSPDIKNSNDVKEELLQFNSVERNQREL